MKDLSLVSGIKELDRINQYALEALTPEEKQFIEKINKIVEDYENGIGNIFGFNEQIKIQMLWQKKRTSEAISIQVQSRRKNVSSFPR